MNKRQSTRLAQTKTKTVEEKKTKRQTRVVAEEEEEIPISKRQRTETIQKPEAILPVLLESPVKAQCLIAPPPPPPPPRGPCAHWPILDYPCRETSVIQSTNARMAFLAQKERTQAEQVEMKFMDDMFGEARRDYEMLEESGEVVLYESIVYGEELPGLDELRNAVPTVAELSNNDQEVTSCVYPTGAVDDISSGGLNPMEFFADDATEATEETVFATSQKPVDHPLWPIPVFSEIVHQQKWYSLLSSNNWAGWIGTTSKCPTKPQLDAKGRYTCDGTSPFVPSTVKLDRIAREVIRLTSEHFEVFSPKSPIHTYFGNEAELLLKSTT
jgi:hypothetical protein